MPHAAMRYSYDIACQRARSDIRCMNRSKTIPTARDNRDQVKKPYTAPRLIELPPDSPLVLKAFGSQPHSKDPHSIDGA